jgi:RHS repeat-associated protein
MLMKNAVRLVVALVLALIFSPVMAQAVTGIQYSWNPPYMIGGSTQTYPTLDEAESATWSEYWTALGRTPTCNYTVLASQPSNANGGVVATLYVANLATCIPNNPGDLGPLNLAITATVTTSPNQPNVDQNLGPNSKCACGGDPISLATGNKYEVVSDGHWGRWLKLDRYYNSVPGTGTALAAPFGYWSNTYNRILSYKPASQSVVASVSYTREDGRTVQFTQTNGVWSAGPQVQDMLTETTDASGNPTQWQIYRADTLETETYPVTNGATRLASITDKDGFVTKLAYDTTDPYPSASTPAAGKLITVTDPVGRTLTFNWTYNASIYSTYLTSVDAPGETIQYDYNYNTSYFVANLASATYGDNSGIKYVWNESSNAPYSYPSQPALTGVIDETQTRYETTTYGQNGVAQSTGHSNDVDAISVTYNGDGSAAVTEPLGIKVTYGFAVSNGLGKVTSHSGYCSTCIGLLGQATYDSNSNPLTTTDHNGNVTATTYSSAGLLTQQVEAQGQPAQRTTVIQWNTTFRKPTLFTVSNAQGTLTSEKGWLYNGRGQVLARCEIDPANSAASSYTCSNTGSVPAGVRRWTYTYCDAVDGVQCPVMGLLLTVTGPRADLTQTTNYSYYMSSSAVNCGTPGAACYQAGDVHEVTDALGHVTTIVSYDAAGRPTRTADANGVNTDMTYTPRGWLASRSVGGATTSFTYTPYGAVKTVTDPDGVTTTYGYDTAHRLNQITDALGNYIQYTLDAAGDKTGEQVYDASGIVHKQLTRTFNNLGQLVEMVDGLGQAVFNASASGSYDANSNLILSTDALGFHHQLGYDALNRLAQTIDNYNGADTATQNTTAKYSYDSQDRVAQVTDPSGFSTTYSYDGLSDVTSQVSPDTGATSRTFDAAGNVLTSTDAKGVITTNTYDALDRLISKSYTDTTQNVTYSYDDVSSATGCSSSYPTGRLTRIIEHSVSTVYCYDARGNVIQKQQILNGNTDTTGYAISAAGRLSSIVYPSGTQVTYTRDSDGRIQTVSVTPPNGSASTAVSSVTYQPFGPVNGYTLGNNQVVTRTYDANYRLTDLTSPAFNLHVARDAMGDIIAIGNAAGANPAIETYSYDPLQRLTAITEADGAVLESVTYNQTGDRLSKAGAGLAIGAYSYNANTHQLIAAGNAARTPDANGNTTAISEAGSTYGFGYSDRNRPIVVQLNGSAVANYTYNAIGQRVEKVVNGSTERYGYSDTGSQMLDEYGGTNRDYVWLDGIPVANVDTQGTTSTVSYVTADSLGTPRAIANAAGTTQWQWAYQGNPWGEQTPTSNGYVYNLGFPGQYADAETGLNYNVNRDYDPKAGRYMESDPLGLAAGLSTYAYALGNPISYTDQLGLVTTIIINSNFPIIGDHASLYVSHGTLDGQPAGPEIYDPSGSYLSQTRGDDGTFFDQEANLINYLQFQLTDGTNIQQYTFNTTAQQEMEIANRAQQWGDPRGLNCAWSVSNVLNGIGPFKNLGTYNTPSGLGAALSNLSGGQK